ncbi:alpha/beta hydrolase [Agromyces neolithicus]|uniref:Alpha/beta hydrolase n=1 Tax=Agromyces neolithicus TaxID=269420 RepID=A0ABN2M9T6_9MICO
MLRARVVLVHGLRTSATMWRRQVTGLARHDIDVVAIDLPGHGVHLGEPFTVEAAMHEIDRALNPDDPEPGAVAPGGRSTPAVPRLLVGLSLGGYLAIEFAARHPNRVDGLVAASCGTRPRGIGLTAYQQLAALIGRLPDKGRGMNDAVARLFLSADAVDDVLAGGVALDVMGPVLRAVEQFEPEASLASLDIPVWFVNGQFDHFRTEERRLLKATRDGRLVIIPGATHLVSLTRPDHFTAVVVGAVAELDRRWAARRRARFGTAAT